MSNDLSMNFLNHFQLPVHYDIDTELLSTFGQDKATHISDHIQEWRRRKRLIKAFIPSKFLLEWFLKSSKSHDQSSDDDPPGTPLHIEKPTDKPKAAPRIPKGVLKHSRHNPNARATQNYSKGRLCFLPLV